MTELPDHLRRIEALETHFTHQDQVIAELNEVITAQWRRIDMLERQMRRLRDEMQTSGPPRDAAEPPPPHY